MLVLTRKLNERIQIGDNITVSILRIKGNAVRIGIAAPREVRVVRGELPPKALDALANEPSAEEEPVAGRDEADGPEFPAAQARRGNVEPRNMSRPAAEVLEFEWAGDGRWNRSTALLDR